MGKVLVIEHAGEGSLALFGEWFDDAGLVPDVVRPYAGDVLPDVADRDAIVVLGGPMSAYDDDRYPWLAGTKRLLSAYVEEGMPTLGICLGHQLLTVARGGEVRPNPAGEQQGLKDIGLGPRAAGDRLFGGLEPPVRAVQWNDDVVCRLPAGAEPLATGADGWPQAYRLGESAWGVQFHPEVGVEQVTAWAAGTAAVQHPTGPDLDTKVRAIGEAADELRRTWRPFAARFAALVNAGRGR